MDAINLDILKQLQEYAQMYFNAIVEANTTCGKCKFADGQYTAKDVTKWNYRQPEDDLYDEDVTLQSGTFKCKFPYRRIFEVLNDWESMSRAGKLKTVFEIGETETKSAKVLIQEKTALGAFKFKSMKLQRIAGNWWRPTKLPKYGQVWLYHETNGVMHIGGRQVFASELEDCPERIEAFCEKWNDEEFIKLMSKYNPGEDSEFNGYYTKVLELAGISNEPEQPATATETAKTENEPQEETNESVKHISEIIETCRLHDDNGEETDEYKYYKWLTNAHCGHYRTIAEEALVEVLTRAGIHIETEETAAIMEAAKEEKRKREEKKATVAAKKPIWKQANELAGEYDKRGYQFVYNERTKLCYLTIPGHIFVDGSQCTTELTYVMTGKIDDFRDIPKAVGEYNAMYCAKYAERCPQMLAYLPTEPREAGIGREPQGQEAKCRLAPSWVANRVLPHGFRVLCFSSYPNGDFSISVENKEGCRILTKDKFRKLCSEPPQSPTTSTDIQTIKPPEKRAQTARKEPKRTIQISLIVQRPQPVVRNLRTSQSYHFADVRKMVVPRLVKNVPRGCFTEWSPPIRGDCVIV